jgi:hypothetical protein
LGQSSSIAPDTSERVYATFQSIDGNEREYAGASVAMNPTGEYIAVGFKEANGPVERAGLVRVYRRIGDDDSYVPYGLDSMFGRAAGDEFGSSVSISNDGQRVAVGARSSSQPEKLKNGEVGVFEYSSASNSWVQLGSSIQGTDEKDRFGFSVSLSGDGRRLAAGAPGGNGRTGSASVHEYDGTDWAKFEDVDQMLMGDNVGDRAGFSLSLSNDGTSLAVGAFTSSKNGLSSSGSVSVFRLEDSSFIPHGQTLMGWSDGAQFGFSVALSGDGRRLVVGSSGFGTAAAAKVGLCEVFDISESSAWTQIGNAVGGAENEEAGLHVSISTDGSVVSCSKVNLYEGGIQGTVAILQQNSTNWDLVDSLVTVQGNSSFGTSVSLSQDGKLIAVGAPSYNSTAGRFELFTVSA